MTASQLQSKEATPSTSLIDLSCFNSIAIICSHKIVAWKYTKAEPSTCSFKLRADLQTDLQLEHMSKLFLLFHSSLCLL